MLYEIGNTVRIKSLEWYHNNADKNGNINCGEAVFSDEMSRYCGQLIHIVAKEPSDSAGWYAAACNPFAWTDEMIECQVADKLTYINNIISLDKQIAIMQKQRKEIIGELIKNYSPFNVGQKVLVTIPSHKVYNIASGQHEVIPEQKKYAFVAENTYDEYEKKVLARFVICKKDGTPGKKTYYVPRGVKIKPVNG